MSTHKFAKYPILRHELPVDQRNAKSEWRIAKNLCFCQPLLNAVSPIDELQFFVKLVKRHFEEVRATPEALQPGADRRWQNVAD